MSDETWVVAGWLLSVVLLYFERRIWRGDKKTIESQIDFFGTFLGASRRTGARIVAAHTWGAVAVFLMTTGACLLIFGVPEQRREVTGEAPTILFPFVGMFFLALALGTCIVIFGRPKWAVPRVLQERVL